MDIEHTLKRTLPQRSLAQHEVYLSFSTDQDATAFTEWLRDTGWGEWLNHWAGV